MNADFDASNAAEIRSSDASAARRCAYVRQVFCIFVAAATSAALGGGVVTLGGGVGDVCEVDARIAAGEEGVGCVRRMTGGDVVLALRVRNGCDIILLIYMTWKLSSTYLRVRLH